MVGLYDSGFYLLKTKKLGFSLLLFPIAEKQKLILEYYDKNFVLKGTIPLNNIHQKMYNRVDNSFEFFAQDEKENLFIFYSKKFESKTILYKSKLDRESLEFTNPEIISEQKNIKKNSRQKSYKLLRSPNGQKKAIVSIVESEDKDKTNINIDFLDKDFNKISSTEEILPFKKVNVAFEDIYFVTRIENNNIPKIVLSNNGEIAVLARVDRDKSRFKLDYEYSLVGFSENQKPARITKLNIGKKSILSLSLAFPDDGGNQFLCYGFFNTRKINKYNIDGNFSLFIDAQSLEILEESILEFDLEDISNFLIPKGSKSKKNTKLREQLQKGKDHLSRLYYLRNINHFDDGSYTVMAEIFMVQAIVGLSTVYFCQDMVFLHYDDRGKLEWIRNIYKNQSSPDIDGFMGLGTFHFQLNDKIYLLYRTSTRGETLLTILEKNGEFKKVVVATIGEKTELGKFYPRSSTFQLIRPSEAIGFGFKKERIYKALRLKL